MESLAPEAMLENWLGDRKDVISRVISEPIRIPYDRLAAVDGWIVWAGHPPVPDGISLLPVPESLLWDAPETAIATALLVAADYAIRRGAIGPAQLTELLGHECPVAIVVPDRLHESAADVLDRAETAGIPVVRHPVESMTEVAGRVPSFEIRRSAHQVDLGRWHDPAFSFQIVVPDVTIGDNPQSSFIVHDAPAVDGVSVSGELGKRIGIEIGVAGPGITFGATRAIEQKARVVPSFMDGISVSSPGERMVIGWREDDRLDPWAMGELFRTWLKAITGANTVDVRLTFVGDSDGPDSLAAFRARAASIQHRRATA